MSDIVLSASVRQNLLSLQSTADLLSTTQTRLATGKKVNSALDNPTNFFTAAGLDARASDINNLLDGIGNGVQVLQAANTGITSLQKLVDTAKSIANQALQTTVGYSTKSTFTSAAITGATADNLLGTDSTATAGTFTTAGTFATLDVSAGVAPTAATITGATNSFTGPLNVAGTASTLPGVATTAVSVDFSGSNALTFDLSFDNGTTTESITIDSAAIVAAGGTAATATQANIITALNTEINAAFGTTGVVYAANNAGKIDITSGTTGTSAQVDISGYAETGTLGGATGIADGTGPAGTSANKLSFDITVDGATTPTTVTIDQDAVNAYNTANSTTLDAAALTGANVASLINDQLGANIASYSSANQALSFTSATTGTGSHLTIAATAVAGATTNTTGIANHAITDGAAGSGTTKSLSFNLTVDGGAPTAITLSDAALTTYNTDVANAANLITDPASALSGADVAKLINYQAGSAVATFTGGKLTFTSATTGAASSVAVSAVTPAGGATDTTGIGSGGSNTGAAAVTTGLTGNVLSIAASTDGSIPAVSITFGTGTGEVKSLNDLNNALASSHLQASLSTDGKITITTSNDYASSRIGAVSGTATDTGEAFVGAAPPAAVADPVAQTTRANLVTQYNNVIDQIRTTAQDASFNGVNLLNGDQLKLVFNETGKSTLNITGVDFNPAGLGLGTLSTGTDFIDNAATNKVLASLNDASSTLRGQASALGSNLSIVQIRQDFSKNLINVLQTGSSNLTLADTNEEAANSQALATRQSIAVSALALANQSQQSVLQLLR